MHRFPRSTFALILTTAALLPSSRLLSFEEYTFEGYGFFYYVDSYQDSTNCHARDGIWRVDLATGEEEQIFGDNSGKYLIERCGLSYNGKQLVFKGTSIGNGMINNDGTGYQKLSSSLPLTIYPPGAQIFWSKLGFYAVFDEQLRRYDLHTGDYEVVPFPPLVIPEEGTYNCFVSGDGTRIWTRALQSRIGWGPKLYRTYCHTYFIMNDDGSPARLHSRNWWGHHETISLDGAHMLFQNFGHDGIWLLRHDDGQHSADILYKKTPIPEPNYDDVCGSYPQGDALRYVTNSNVWIYMYFRPRKIGHGELFGTDERCFFQTVWNWRTNKRVKIHGPEDGTWMKRCRSLRAVRCAGIWKGYDLPALDDNTAYLVSYRKNVTFQTANKTSAMEKEVRVGNIDDAALEGIAVKVEPQGADSWLDAVVETTTNSSITLTVKVDPTALTQDSQSAEVVVSAESARNTASFMVHADNTMLPRPENFVVFHANMSDSFAYPELTWEDVAEGEDGYYVEFYTHFEWWVKDWEVIDTLAPNTTRYLSPRYRYTNENKNGHYRIRAFTDDGLVSPYSDEGWFAVPPDSLVPPPPELVLEPWEEGDESRAKWKRVTDSAPRRHSATPRVSHVRDNVVVEPAGLSSRGRVSIVVPSGRVVANRSYAGSCSLALPAPTSGVYLIRIVDASGARRTIRSCILHQ